MVTHPHMSAALAKEHQRDLRAARSAGGNAPGN